MKIKGILFLAILFVAAFSLTLACDGDGDDDDSEVGGISANDDDDDSEDDDDDWTGGGTNECGTYGSVGCDDSDERACESGNLANQDRYEHPEESDCAVNLQWSDDLAQVAYEHSKDMCDRDFFEHANPDGKSPFDRMDDAGIAWVAAGENIAAGTNLTASQANDMWMNEPECEPNHRSNLLSRKFTHIGVGFYDCGNMIYVTQDFATFSFADIPDDPHDYCGGDF